MPTEIEFVPDWNEVDRLAQVTTSETWPRRWMTIPEFRDELDARDWWGSGPMGALSQDGKAEWLGCRFEAEPELHIPFWPGIGSRYKHHDLITIKDAGDLADWNNSQAAAATENLNRLKKDLEG